MIKKDIVENIVKETGLKRKDAKLAFEAGLEQIKEALANGEKVTLVGFGTFETRDRKAKRGTDPSSGKKIMIKEKTIPYFKSSKELKEKVDVKKKK